MWEFGLGRMGLKSAFGRMRHGGFGQGMGHVSNLIEAGCGCWERCVYVRGCCIGLAQGPV